MDIITSGDLGDDICLLPSLKYFYKEGISIDLHLVTRPFTKAYTTQRLDAIIPLLETQSYINRICTTEPKGRHIDASTFRSSPMVLGRTLAEYRARWLNIKISLEPWLDLPKQEKNGLAIFHRSTRYNNPLFKWKEIVQYFGDRAVCIGSEEERLRLKEIVGNIEYIKTDNLLDVAKLIAGCDMFVGNQSSPLNIALALPDINIIESVCNWIPDCIYPREKAIYCESGYVPGVTKLSEFFDRKISPRNGWKLPNGKVVRLLQHAMNSYSLEEILQANINDCPHLLKTNKKLFNTV